MKRITILLLFLSTGLRSYAGDLKPGFNKAEYLDMLTMAALQIDTPWTGASKQPANYVFIHRSAVCGLDNKWDLWKSKDGSTGVISVRGTTLASTSWLANFYAAMVPARGELRLANDFIFNYELSDHPEAAVHVGWLIGMAYLSRDIVAKIDSCHRTGIRNFILTGHSQGGGITFLLTAYLKNLQKKGQLPADITFKTYCSAGPKPGNTYFAYYYENLTRGGWAYNVVNSADWVPETPISIQTERDFNTVNPFKNARKMLKKQKFPANVALMYFYNGLTNPTRKAQKRYEKFLGEIVARFVKQALPEYTAPCYFKSSNYARTGNTIVLYAGPDYYTAFPDDEKQIFIHHLPPAYFFNAEKLQDQP